MIRQSLVFDDLLEKKYKILRASIILGNVSDKDNIFKEYEDAAREINKINSDIYEEKLASKMYTTVTLDEELVRLKDLIMCIQNRIDEKNAFLDDYMKVTSNYLEDADNVSGEESLEEYKLRLSNINEYLNNCKEIERINERLGLIRDELAGKYDIKSNNELINSKLEDELIEEFNKLIAKDEYYLNINYSEIDSEINKLLDGIKEKEVVMNTFVSSYDALVNAGISGSEREEYSTYVKDARVDYYNDLEKKYILDIYKIVLDKVLDYDRLYEKREKLAGILFERESNRKKLDITSRDELEYFIRLCEEQFNIIKSQKFNLEEIGNLENEIKELEAKLKELTDANNRKEIVDILEEFAITKTKEEEEGIFETLDADINDYKPTGPIKSNMVIKIKDPVKINVKTAMDTAKLVMKKVVIVLEPKKFNEKKDKSKDVVEQTSGATTGEEKVFTSDQTLGIELATRAVGNAKDVKEVNDLDAIKINTDENNNIKVPTEIFIEEPKEEPLDLFTVTDPFLDDNYLDTGEKTKPVNSIPKIENIGTVKPNSTFAKIEEVVKENDDIILPTLGLSEQEKVNVPIVSGNYIN